MPRKVFVLAIGAMPNPVTNPVERNRTVNFIKKLPGLVGVHLHNPEYTLLCFDSVDSAEYAYGVLTEFIDTGGAVGNVIMNAEISDDDSHLSVKDVAKDIKK